jgi:integrase/recombinase XerD
MDSDIKSRAAEAITEHLLNTKAKTTKIIERIRLAAFCKYTFNNDDILTSDWSKLSKKNILTFVEHKKTHVQFDTANAYLTALKMISKTCYQYNVINQKDLYLIKSIKPYHGATTDKGRALSLKEVNKVKTHFSNAKNGRDYRNFAIFALAIGCGLRRNEISTLNIEDIKGRKMHVCGKGNKTRTTYLSKFTLDALKNWLKQLNRRTGPLFVHITQGDRIKAERLGVKGIHYVIDSIQKKAKVKAFKTHDLRRTFATTLLHGNTDIFTVQTLLGHSNPMTTKRYDKRGENGKIKAINSLPF